MISLHGKLRLLLVYKSKEKIIFVLIRRIVDMNFLKSKTMSKPIFIWRVPLHAVVGNSEQFEQIQQDLQAKLSDYHVLCMTDPGVSSPQFECYNAVNAEEKDIEELKQMGTAMLNSRSRWQRALEDMMRDDEDSGLYEEDETNSSI
jgi:hypothetical protein